MIIVHWDNRTNYVLLQESTKDCYEATVPTDVPADIKAECGDIEIVYVKTVDCPKGIATLLFYCIGFNYNISVCTYKSYSTLQSVILKFV